MAKNNLELLEKIRWNEPDSSLGLLKEFIDSPVHWDFRNEIIARIEDLRDKLENSTNKDQLETRGAIDALRRSMGIFEDLYEMKKSDLNRKELQEEKRNED